MMKFLKLNKKKKYLLACSFGPDSMALLNMLKKEGYFFKVAHVNYGLREEAKFETENLKKYCEINDIKLFIKEAKKPEKTKVNTEEWARKIRYDFFGEILRKNKDLCSVLVAHNEDDLLETYLLQCERNNVVSYYGLREQTRYKNYWVLRPLLGYKKAYLQKYCDKNKVPYAIDKSNFDTKYRRNYHRKYDISNLDDEGRKRMIEEINEKNKENQELRKKLLPLINNDKEIDVSQIKKLNKKEFNFLLIEYLKKCKFYRAISYEYSGQLYDTILSKTTWHDQFNDVTFLCLDYGVLKLYQIKQKHMLKKFPKSFYKINENSKDFRLIKGKEIEVRNNLPTSNIYRRGLISKKVSRCFIDWKVPYVYRLLWPAIYEKNGKILFMPHYKKDFAGDKNSLLIFDIKNFLR